MNADSEKFLSGRALRIYQILRGALYFLAFILAILAALAVFFPKEYFPFSLLTPNSGKNALTGMKTDSGNFPEKRVLKNGERLFFFASSAGNFSQAKISVKLDKKSAPAENLSVRAQKSYQAFFYPEGGQTSFRPGSLIKNSGRYFLVSKNALFRFQNSRQLSAMGFSEEAFREVPANDLKWNGEEKEIKNPEDYPDYSLFKIRNDYYVLLQEKLKKFVSEKAFLSRYDALQAAEKQPDFLSRYPLNEESEGFRDGTVLSFGGTVYLVSGKNIFPVGDPVIFQSLGYGWNDLIDVGSDEISLYEKTKVLPLSGVHPDGTVFLDENSGRYFLIREGKKHPLSSSVAAYSWTKSRPIPVSAKSLEISAGCRLKKDALAFRSYSCVAPIENLNGLPGKDYRFELTAGKDLKIEKIEIKMEKKISRENLLNSIFELIYKAKQNYAK